MKKLSLFVVASFMMLSLGANAGERCLYGIDAKVAEGTADKDQLDPKLLALLKKEQEQLEKSSPYPTFN